MHSLSQNYLIDEEKYREKEFKIMEAKEDEFHDNEIKKEQILQAIEYLELKSLSLNHSLFEREKIYYESKYNLDKFASELGLCVVVNSHNNIEK